MFEKVENGYENDGMKQEYSGNMEKKTKFKSKLTSIEEKLKIEN
jgi:hypothetical protein